VCILRERHGIARYFYENSPVLAASFCFNRNFHGVIVREPTPLFAGAIDETIFKNFLALVLESIYSTALRAAVSKSAFSPSNLNPVYAVLPL